VHLIIKITSKVTAIGLSEKMRIQGVGMWCRGTYDTAPSHCFL